MKVRVLHGVLWSRHLWVWCAGLWPRWKGSSLRVRVPSITPPLKRMWTRTALVGRRYSVRGRAVALRHQWCLVPEEHDWLCSRLVSGRIFAGSSPVSGSTTPAPRGDGRELPVPQWTEGPTPTREAAGSSPAGKTQGDPDGRSLLLETPAEGWRRQPIRNRSLAVTPRGVGSIPTVSARALDARLTGGHRPGVPRRSWCRG